MQNSTPSIIGVEYISVFLTQLPETIITESIISKRKINEKNNNEEKIDEGDEEQDTSYVT